MSGTVDPGDSYVEKLRKSIPGEVTTLYLSLKLVASQAIIGSDPPTAETLAAYLQTIIPFILVVLLIAALYLYAVSGIRNLLQIAITVVSLFMWTVAIDISYFSQVSASYQLPWLFDLLARHNVSFLMLVIVWNFCIPIIYALQPAGRSAPPVPPGPPVPPVAGE
jgi:hypothetical protein